MRSVLYMIHRLCFIMSKLSFFFSRRVSSRLARSCNQQILQVSTKIQYPTNLSKQHFLNHHLLARHKTTTAADRDDGFVDIHDISGPDPGEYDVVLTDLNDDVFRTKNSNLANRSYLQLATKEEADSKPKHCQGLLYGMTFRTILPCVVRFKDRAH